ncbi:MAG TPA: GNAT family N-acetyltransferase [Solirubrobacteraceae bacterium]|nr:GNAT family N-acetyltransferase [Solirubrobacteraceae bacterium]
MHIDTERLHLRPMTMRDVDDLVALHADPEVSRFTRPFNREEAIERLRHDDSDWREYGHGLFALLASDDGRFLGRVALKYWPQYDEAEVGWVLRRHEWGHGYATEAARACAEWGFRAFAYPYLTAMIAAENARSVRVAERLGMTRLRDDSLFDVPVVVHFVERRTFYAESQN